MDEQKKDVVEEKSVNDLELRVKQFNEEFIPLLGKYNLALGASAFFTPDGRVIAKSQLIDAEKIAKEQAEKEDKEVAEIQTEDGEVSTQK